jgi:lipid-binding SYLF domain-containing protein
MKKLIALAILPLLFGLGCNSPKGENPQEKRDEVMKMHDDVLKAMYAAKPELKDAVAKAPGYAVFSNASLTFFFVGGGGGYGVAVDQKNSGRKTFMKMASGNFGLGLGVKDFRALYIFNEASAYTTFITKGWVFGAEAAASATDAESGGSAEAAGTMKKAVEIHQLTDAGVILKATIEGAKYSVDWDLTKP